MLMKVAHGLQQQPKEMLGLAFGQESRALLHGLQDSVSPNVQEQAAMNGTTGIATNGARTLLVAPGITTRNKQLLVTRASLLGVCFPQRGVEKQEELWHPPPKRSDTPG